MNGDTPPRSTLEFTGTAAEYFKIWIVNICFTLLTLGVYSAWAKVRRLRYFHGNTSLIRHGFAYNADPVRILKGRIIAVTCLVLYLGATHFAPRLALGILSLIVLLVPAIIVIASRFNLRNTTYRNIRFDLGARVVDAYRVFLRPLFILVGGAWLLYLLTENSGFVRQMEAAAGGEFQREDLFVTFFLMLLAPLFPYIDYLRVRFLIDHMYWGALPARFDGGMSRFYEVYIVSGVVTGVLALLLILCTGVMVAIIGGISGASGDAGASKTGAVPGFMLWGMVAGSLVGYLAAIAGAGYLRARRSNVIVRGTRFGNSVLYSDIGPWRMGWLYAGNTVAILASAGLLIPWATIRTARYVAGCTSAEIHDADVTGNSAAAPGTALGEELVDAFDMDVGL